MKIIRVTIHNLNSLKLKKTIDFTAPPLGNVGLFAITGDTGAGKTTLLDAITLALYGRIHRNKEVTEVMSYGAIECLAEVEFESAQGRFRSKWSTYRSRRKADGNIQAPKRELARWDPKTKKFAIIAEKIRDVDAKVEKVTGLDYDRFTRSVLLSQGDFAAFLRAGERERSDLLERITGTGVYTRISMAAYERAKSEQARLDDLRREQQALQLLSHEELNEIEEQITENRQRAETLQSELASVRQQIQWHITKAELEQRQMDLKAQHHLLNEQLADFQADQRRLELHRQVIPHLALLEKYFDSRQRQEELLHTETQIGRQIAHAKEQLEDSKKAFAEQQAAFQKLRSEKKTQWPLFDRVIAMDAELRERQAAYQELEVALQEAEKEYLEAQQTLKQKENNIAENVAALKALEYSLEEQKELSALGRALPTLEAKYQELATVIEQEEQLRQKRESQRSQHDMLKKQEQVLNGQFEKARTEGDATLQLFRQEIPSGYTASRSDILQLLHQDIERLHEQREQLKQLHQLNTEYQQLLSDFAEYEEQLQSLQSAEAAVDKEVMSSLEVLDALTAELEYKQLIYEQQLRIANYEKDRHVLEEGQPCPLCFSTHHPFREHGIEPFVDQARIDWEQVSKRYEQALQAHRTSLDRQKELKIEVERLAGRELQELGGEVAKQYERILSYEQRLAHLASDEAGTTDLTERPQKIEQRMRENDIAIAQQKTSRDRLLRLNEKLEQQEAQIRKLDQQLQDIKSRLLILDEKELLLLEQQEGLSARKEEILEQIREVFKQQNRTFDLQQATQQYEALVASYEKYTNEVDTRRRQVHQLELDRQKADQLRQANERLERMRRDLSANLDEAKNKLEDLQQQRQQLLDDRDPVAEKERLEHSIDLAQEAMDDLQKRIADQQAQFEALEQLRLSKQQDKQNVEQQLSKWGQNLSQIALDAGFEDIEALNAARLDADIANQLEQRHRELEREKITLERSLEDTIQALTQVMQNEAPDGSLDDLQQHLTDREADYERIQQTIGALTQKQLADKQRRQTADKLIGQIQAQEKEYLRWSQLNDIIGQADGKKFRIFAQGLTLSKLVALANHHLELLNGRYQIRKQDDAGLELQIIDTFQADNVRSMNTLSGGESFLVSLALALGLSDLAGRDARIRSLFIDEGFGTLDDNSLDLAIDTLENLQSDGKTIGVISHVKALKERIGAQIQVSKQGTGFSTITIVG